MAHWHSRIVPSRPPSSPSRSRGAGESESLSDSELSPPGYIQHLHNYVIRRPEPYACHDGKSAVYNSPKILKRLTKIGHHRMENISRKFSLVRSKSFQDMPCLTAESQDEFLNARRMDRYRNKTDGNNEPLPAPTKFVRSTSSALSQRGKSSEMEQMPAPKLDQHMKRSVSESAIQTQ